MDKSTFDTMRAVLVPRGTFPVVRIGGDAMYMDAEFIQQCINDAERACQLAAVGIDQPTPLEVLAMQVLRQTVDSTS